MGKKGFTLAELLGIITILGIISLIVVPIVSKNIKKSKQNLYDVQIDSIKEAAKSYIANKIREDNEDVKNKCQSNNLYVTLAELKSEGFIDEIENPLTGKYFSNDVTVTVTCNGSEYLYEVFTE